MRKKFQDWDRGRARSRFRGKGRCGDLCRLRGRDRVRIYRQRQR
jgi:hypothetical protein